MNIKNLKKAYEQAKSKRVGETCSCPSCRTAFVKVSYQQAFCKSRPGTECKDFYWNNVTPSKRNNTTRISPANALWSLKNDTPVVYGYGDSQKAIDREDRERIELEEDGSWDSHQANVGRCEWCECLICRCED